MTLEAQLYEEMIGAYYRAGSEIGYWGRYFLCSVKKNGGLATAKRMLQAKNKGHSTERISSTYRCWPSRLIS